MNVKWQMISLVSNVSHEQQEFVKVQHGLELEEEHSSGAIHDDTLPFLRKSIVLSDSQHFLQWDFVLSFVIRVVSVEQF
jgi:hypothetical protein